MLIILGYAPNSRYSCQVFFYVPKQFRKKLSNSALPGIFLGYDLNPSTYKIYDITNNKVILSRSVIFFEDNPDNCNSPSSIPDFINFTPYYENGGDNNSDIDNDYDFYLSSDSNVNNNNNNNNNNNINNNNNNNNNINY